MKIGSRVRLSSTVNFRFKDMREPSGIPRGYVTKIISRGWRGRFLQIKYDHGPIIIHHEKSLIEERFPFTWHRTMAQVMADEQGPEAA